MKHKHEHITAHDRMQDRKNLEHGMHGHHSMHKMHHSKMAGPTEHFGQSMREESSRGMYRNEVEMPEVAAWAHPGEGQGARPDMGCMDFKGEADPIAFGQAQGHMKEDHRRIESQFKDYHWD